MEFTSLSPVKLTFETKCVKLTIKVKNINGMNKLEQTPASTSVLELSSPEASSGETLMEAEALAETTDTAGKAAAKMTVEIIDDMHEEASGPTIIYENESIANPELVAAIQLVSSELEFSGRVVIVDLLKYAKDREGR